MDTMDERHLREAAEILSETTRLAVLTGAGISAESGVPTFRGSGGFWQGRSAMELATPQAFRRDPEGVWEFYRFRITGLEDVQPNDGHRALVDLENRCERFWLITQPREPMRALLADHAERRWPAPGCGKPERHRAARFTGPRAVPGLLLPLSVPGPA